tara:strand:- start:647 stop:1000 length:354 start_codon:yes stop_codon:yes gene_type:complete
MDDQPGNSPLAEGISRMNSYWDKTGKYQADADALTCRVPASGDIKGQPKLERFRKASNAYYDLFNNAGFNRPQLITATFGRGLTSRARLGQWDIIKAQVEPIMDQIILDAIAEATGA